MTGKREHRLRDDDKIIVCDRCFQASCLQGIFMCDDSDIAGTTTKTVRELRVLTREHWSFWIAGVQAE